MSAYFESCHCHSNVQYVKVKTIAGQNYFYIHTYHSRFISDGVAEVSQIFLRDTHALAKLAMRNTADVTGGKPISQG
jgi:hypothetical protein